jgi:beta-galactosidase
MRAVYPFNRGWLFAPQDLPADAPDAQFTRVSLPHTNIELPLHSFDNADYQFISTYRQRFTLPEALAGRRLFLDFDGAMTVYQVWLNGVLLGEHKGGYTPASFDLTDALRDGENVLHVRLDSSERPDVPPNGYVVDYLTFGGIYREVHLRYVEPLHIADAWAHGEGVLTNAPHAQVLVTVRNDGVAARAVLAVTIRGEAGEAGSAQAAVSVAPGRAETIAIGVPLRDLRLWRLEDPALYRVDIRLRTPDAAVTHDAVEVRTGFREARFTPEGFFLNGEKIKVVGLNRHQTYPFIGGAAPARMQRKDADILKHELGVNLARTSHYPQSPHFLDRCDEIGLLVFEEIPGWQSIGDEEWKDLSVQNVERMIVRDRHHPSIVLWGVRINESPDDEYFYRATNARARELDPTRQTGGVRNFQESQFLEDVFTYNDFSNTILPPSQTPYLVTEFNGHMFPTKSYDCEEHQVEHALRHARIQDTSFGMESITGAIGWCAFDYNTHREFGAGDRICHHGVSDIFRLPKFAAWVYESQIAPAVRPVLRVASFWAFGEREGAGTEPLYVFTNCDEIAVYKGGSLHGHFRPDREQFPHLPHPPVKVMGFSQFQMFAGLYEPLRVVGYRDGEAVIEEHISARGLPAALTLQADDDALHADGADMTRLVFRIVDEHGHRMPFCTAVVQFTLEGPGTLVGENPFPLVGGQAAVYVRAGETPGEIRVTARARTLPPASVRIRSGEA